MTSSSSGARVKPEETVMNLHKRQDRKWKEIQYSRPKAIERGKANFPAGMDYKV